MQRVLVKWQGLPATTHWTLRYDDTAVSPSPTTRSRRLAGQALLKSKETYQFGVKQASVQSELDKIVYLRVVADASGELSDRGMGVIKSFFGLKQAGRVLNAKLVNDQKESGFEQCLTKSCLFRLLLRDGKIVVTLAVYTEDPPRIVRGKKDSVKLKEALTLRFLIKNL